VVGHRFGHGKAEALAALGQATLIAGSALFLGAQAIERLRHPQPVAEAGVGLLVIGFVVLVTLALLAFQRFVIRRTGSTAIRADALHYATDLATNGATLAALLLAAAGWSGFDPLFGLAIGAYILYSALRIGSDAVQLLMDRELPDAARGQILDLAASVPGVLGVHGLRTHSSGQRLTIQLHLELDDGSPLLAAHQVSSNVETRIREQYPDADTTIHQDQVSLGEERSQN
jgi:ferrous-iron efflux pump FieF